MEKRKRFFYHDRKSILTNLLIPLGLILIFHSMDLAYGEDQASLVQIIDTSLWSPPSPDPSGICYLNSSDTFLVSDSEVNEMPIFTGDNLFEMTPSGILVDTMTTLPNPPWSFSPEPTGVDLNPINGHLFVSDDNLGLVFEINPGPDGIHHTGDDIITSFDTTLFNSYDPEDITFDSWQGVLFLADGISSEVYKISPGDNGLFDGVPPDGDDQVNSFATASFGITDPEGIVFDPDNGFLYLVGRPEDLLAHITTDGTLVRMFDISVANLRNPSALAYAPSSMDFSVMSIWVMDRGIDNNDDPGENDGKIYEFSIYPITPDNAPPEVSAGQDQTVVLSDDAALDGTVFDDGLPDPPGQVITTWSTTSGPGTVTFADDSAVDTTASFSTIGTYVLRLTASDGELESSNETTIFVTEFSFTPVADAYVDIREPDTNFGASPSLEVNAFSDGLPHEIAYLRFDVVGLSGPVQFAYLSLEVNNPSVFGGSIHSVWDNSWGEHTITFNNKPNYDSQALDALGPVSVGDIVMLDVTQAIHGDGAYSFAISGSIPGCAGGSDGSMGDSTDPGTHAASSTGEKVYFSSFIPSEDGTVTFIHFEEFSTDGPIRAGVYDSNGDLLACSAELTGNNSNPGVEIHAALDQPVCLVSGQSYYLAVWVGNDGWAGTAYGGSGGGTYYNSDVSSFPSSLSLPGNTQSGSTSIRITANNSPSSFDSVNSDMDGAGYHSREYLDNPPILIIYTASAGVPVAADDAFTTNENVLLAGNVLSNDTLGDDPNTVSEVAGVSNGQLNLNADGSFFYEPDVDFKGTDSFTYRLTDADNESSDATVTITVTPVDDGVPVAANDTFSIDEDTTLAGNVLSNDTLGDDPNTVSEVAGVSNGQLNLNADGSFFYEPDVDFKGTDSFTYRLTDADNESSDATVTITVTPVDDGVPVAADDPEAATTSEGIPVTTINVLLNDTLVDNAVISAFDTASVNAGTVVNNGDGTFNYTPAFNFNGADSFTYTLTDDEGESSTATVTITVTPSTCAGGSDGSMGDSTDPGTHAASSTGEKVYFSSFIPSEDGTVTFIHFEEFSTDGPIRAGVYDSNGDLLACSAELTGNNSNPGVEIHAALDQPVCLVSGQSYYLAVWVGNDGWAGTAYGGKGGAYYTPGTYYNSDVSSFPSSLSLPGNTQSGSTSIRITANNSPSSFDLVNAGVPVAADDAFSIDEDTTLSGNVLSNDTLGDDPNTVSEVAGVSNGQLNLNADGSFFYEPDVDFKGTDSFTYRLTDADNESSDATVTITVTPVDDGVPVAANDTFSIDEDTTLAGNVLSNDTLGDDPNTVSEVAGVSNGQLNLNADGSFFYEPDVDFKGTDSFTYRLTDADNESSDATVTITVTPVDDGVPVAADDPEAATTSEGIPVTTINVLLNDTLVDNAVISAFDTASVNAGTVVNNGDGTFNYTPAFNFNGADSFTYTLTDDEGESSTATVTITVTPSTCAGGSDGSMGDSTDPGTHAASSTGEKVYFSSFIPSEDGTVTFIHFEEFSTDGPIRAGVYDSNGDLLACSAELTGNNSNPGVEIHAALDQPVCLVSGQSYYLAVWVGNDGWAGTAYGGKGGAYYTPGTYYNSDVSSFPSSLSLPGNTQSGSTSIRITANNSPSSFDLVNAGVPVAADDAFSIDEDTTLSGNVLSNDTLGDDPNTVSEVAGVSNGQLNLNADGSFFYEPDVDFKGTDSFTYRLTDADNESSDATVTITVTPVDDGVPVAANDTFSIDEDTTLAGNVLSNDTLGDDPNTVSEVAGVSNGQLNLNADGSFFYEPDVDFKGTDSFTYRLTDADNESSDATVTITVTPVDDGVPVAADDPEAATTSEGIPVTTINVLLNDTLVDNAVISAFDTASVNAGTVVNNGDGTFNYTPAFNFNGADSFTYTLTDDEGESSTATVTITVTPSTCAGGSDGSMGDSTDPGTHAASSTGEKVYFSSFIPSEDGTVTFIHFEEFSTDGPIRAGVYDSNGDLLACSAELTGNNSNPGVEIHAALDQPVCLVSGQSYYLAVWVGNDGWAGTAYGGKGGAYYTPGTYYNSDVSSFPSSLSLPGNTQSGSTSIRITANNSPSSF